MTDLDKLDAPEPIVKFHHMRQQPVRGLDAPDFLDGARAEDNECKEVRRLLGYLWTATGKNHLRPVRDLFAEDDPIIADVERLAIFPEPSDD